MCYNKNSAGGLTTQNYEKYKRQRNKENLLDENTTNATSFWRTLKSIFPPKQNQNLQARHSK